MRAAILLLLASCTTIKWVDIKADHSMIGACATYIKETNTLYVSTPEFCEQIVEERRRKALLEGRDPGEKP